MRRGHARNVIRHVCNVAAGGNRISRGAGGKLISRYMSPGGNWVFRRADRGGNRVSAAKESPYNSARRQSTAVGSPAFAAGTSAAAAAASTPAELAGEASPTADGCGSRRGLMTGLSVTSLGGALGENGGLWSATTDLHICLMLLSVS